MLLVAAMMARAEDRGEIGFVFTGENDGADDDGMASRALASDISGGAEGETRRMTSGKDECGQHKT